MRLPSSSSLVFAALAISSSSSTLSALAAPAGDPAQAQSGVSAAQNDFRAARRGSVSLARSQADDDDETRSEEQVEKRQSDVISMVCGLAAPVEGVLNGVPMAGDLIKKLCDPPSTATTASFGAESVNGDDASNSTNDDPASWSVPNNTTSSVAPTATDTPSRRDGLPVQPTSVPDKADGAFDGVAPTIPVNPVDKVDGAFDGAAGTIVPPAVGNTLSNPTTAPGTATGVVTGGMETAEPAKGVADAAKKVPVGVIDNSPVPAPVQDTLGNVISAVPVRRGNHERDVSPPSPPVQPPVSSAPVQPPVSSAPVQPPVSAAPSPSPPVHPPVSAAPSPPVQPPSAPTTTITSTVTETAAPTPA